MKLKPETNKKIGSILKAVRLKKKLNQTEFSELVGINTNQQLHNIENGRTPAPIRVLKFFASKEYAAPEAKVHQIISEIHRDLASQILGRLK